MQKRKGGPVVITRHDYHIARLCTVCERPRRAADLEDRKHGSAFRWVNFGTHIQVYQKLTVRSNLIHMTVLDIPSI